MFPATRLLTMVRAVCAHSGPPFHRVAQVPNEPRTQVGAARLGRPGRAENMGEGSGSCFLLEGQPPGLGSTVGDLRCGQLVMEGASFHSTCIHFSRISQDLGRDAALPRSATTPLTT